MQRFPFLNAGSKILAPKSGYVPHFDRVAVGSQKTARNPAHQGRAARRCQRIRYREIRVLDIYGG